MIVQCKVCEADLCVDEINGVAYIKDEDNKHQHPYKCKNEVDADDSSGE